MTKMKFLAGCEAGCVGYTKTGYPVRDYQLVSVVGDAGIIGVFQVHEVRGIDKDGSFCVAKSDCMSVSNCSSCEPEYETSYWLDGVQVPNEKLVTRYQVVEVTDIVNAISAFAVEHPDESSPYFSKKCLGKSYQLDGRKKRDKAIIDAVKAVMKG